MKYDEAWVSPIVWCMRQGALFGLLAWMATVVGWGLAYGVMKRRSA